MRFAWSLSGTYKSWYLLQYIVILVLTFFPLILCKKGMLFITNNSSEREIISHSLEQQSLGHLRDQILILTDLPRSTKQKLFELIWCKVNEI